MPAQKSAIAAEPVQSGASKIALARARAKTEVAGVSTPAPRAPVRPAQSIIERARAGFQGSPQGSGLTKRAGLTQLLGRATRPAGEHRPEKPAVHLDAVPVAGTITRVLYRDAQSGRAMLAVKGDKGDTFKLQGALTFDAQVGRRISASAVHEVHPKHGSQFNSEQILEEVPIDRTGAVAYMTRVLAGVDHATACAIYDAFGESCFDVMQDNPSRLDGLRGMDRERTQRIARAWSQDLARRKVWAFLAEHGVTGVAAARIFAKFGDQTARVAREEPFLLAEVEGVSFATADRIASAVGIAGGSDERVAGALAFALESSVQQGNTAMPEGALVAAVMRLTTQESGQHDGRQVENVLAAQVAQGNLVVRTLDGKSCVTPAGLAAAEAGIARDIARLVDAGGTDSSLAAKARAKAEALGDADQSAAVANVFDCPVSVITGRPGCGKTTVIKVITEVANDAGLRVVMAAPTGKAARRMTEATGKGAGTVHSILKPEMGDLEAFRHHADNQLTGDIFVIDESSMMDTQITAAYLEALPSGARLVMVGDSDQLSSVGAGLVLADLMASGKVAVSRLQTPHRTALDSDIVVNAHRIIDGNVAAVDLQGKKDFRFTAALDESSTRATTLARYQAMVGEFGADRVQVLVARKGTSVGVDALNELLRPVVNPPSPSKLEIEVRGRVLRFGDRVMRMSNNKELGVSNGDVGVICEVDPKKSRVTVDFGGRKVVHQDGQLNALQLAYATTIHKSQGSEYDGVITVVPAAHRSMLDRNLVYTAVTRGKKESHVIGDPAVLRAAILRLGAKRCTGLVEELNRAFGAQTSESDRLASPVATPTAATASSAVARSRAARQSNPISGQPAPEHAAATQRASLFRRSRP